MVAKLKINCWMT